LNVSTRSSGVGNTTSYAIDTILSLYGLSFASIRRWGGKIEECPRPTSGQRIESIKTGKVNAVFDEGLHTWLPTALDHRFEVLPLEPKILRQLERLGFQRAVLPEDRFPKLGRDIQTIDFSGWPLITHRWLPNELAYAICEAIDARQNIIPVDDDQPLNMKKLCRSLDASPLGIPLHPGAKRYYREKGYL
jgi:TRAP-type uncharacterized transport system substrate-binding protein